MAVTEIKTVCIRYVALPRDQAKRSRRTLLELQARSILAAAGSGSTQGTEHHDEVEGNQT